LDETKEDASEKQVNGLAKSNFQFDICDRLLNCGPIADMTIGELVQAEDEVCTTHPVILMFSTLTLKIRVISLVEPD
jgi:hypothetical protein